MKQEIWKDVVGYEGIYQVSNLGNVKRDFILKPYKDRKGYFFVNLSTNGKVKCLRVHQLVAKAFIPNILNKKEVNHINGIKTDNRVENLEWTTHRENMIHAFETHLISEDSFKKMIFNAREKNRKPVVQIKNGKIIKTYDSVSQAIRETKIHHISCVANGDRKRAGGYEWKYI